MWRVFDMRAIICIVMISVGLIAKPPARAQSDARGQGVKLKLPDGRQEDLYTASYALVIGVSRYTRGWPNLPGVTDDVKAVAAALQKQGFIVDGPVMDPTRSDFDRVLRQFIGRRGQVFGHRLVVYFAGHGETLRTPEGRELGYLVPADAPNPRRDEGEFIQFAVSMSEIENYAQQIRSKHVLMVFDSCFAGSLFEALVRSRPDVITEKTARPVRLFITAGGADQTVPDRSIFRRQFTEGLDGAADLDRDGYVSGGELGIFLESSVTNYSRRAQTPRWGKIRDPLLDKGDIVFDLSARREEAAKPATTAAVKTPTPTSAPAAPPVTTSNPPATSSLTPVIALPAGVAARALRSAPFTMASVSEDGRVTKQAGGPVQYFVEDLGNGVQLEMVGIRGGRFLMGATETGADNDERPHGVRVSDYWMARYETTQGQWKAVMGGLPLWMSNLGSEFKGDDLPVVSVSWDEAQEFCRRLSARTGGNYRLPTEAEWEYGARAGTTTPFAFGPTITPEVVNYHGEYPYGSAPKGKYLGRPAAVGSLGVANRFGLYDMHGNVWEWCEDWYGDYPSGDVTDPTGPAGGSSRVNRGGSWDYDAVSCRSAYRDLSTPGYRGYSLGFRLVRK